MATTRRYIPVPPSVVWNTLADPANYGDWVVGSKRIRDADPEFPAPGSRFHHTVGFGPLTIRDHSEVLEAEPPRRLRLRVKARPALTAIVVMELEPADGGTRVVMHEEPDGVFAPLSWFPPLQLATKLRNAHALKRLERLARLRT